MTTSLQLPVRYCADCEVWTQCGACPDCGTSLGAPPYAAPVRPGELDFTLLPKRTPKEATS